MRAARENQRQTAAPKTLLRALMREKIKYENEPDAKTQSLSCNTGKLCVSFCMRKKVENGEQGSKFAFGGRGSDAACGVDICRCKATDMCVDALGGSCRMHGGDA